MIDVQAIDLAAAAQLEGLHSSAIDTLKAPALGASRSRKEGESRAARGMIDRGLLARYYRACADNSGRGSRQLGSDFDWKLFAAMRASFVAEVRAAERFGTCYAARVVFTGERVISPPQGDRLCCLAGMFDKDGNPMAASEHGGLFTYPAGSVAVCIISDGSSGYTRNDILYSPRAFLAELKWLHEHTHADGEIPSTPLTDEALKSIVKYAPEAFTHLPHATLRVLLHPSTNMLLVSAGDSVYRVRLELSKHDARVTARCERLALPDMTSMPEAY